MQHFYWLLLCFFMLWQLPFGSSNAQHRPAHLDTALTYFGTTELLEAENHGPEIKRFLHSVGLRQGNPYCAAFVSYCLDAAGHAGRPDVRSGLAQDFITSNSIKAKRVARGLEKIPSGSVGIHKRGNTIYGHAWFVLLDWKGRTGITIEANTGTGLDGSRQGVWIRQRSIYPTRRFRITHFTPVRYEN